jgi:hypothetical protein
LVESNETSIRENNGGIDMASIHGMATALRQSRNDLKHAMEMLGALKHTLEAIAEQPRNGDWVVEKLEEAGVPIGGEEE